MITLQKNTHQGVKLLQKREAVLYLFFYTLFTPSSHFYLGRSVVDPHHFEADPDSYYHPDEDPDSDFYLIRIRIRIYI